MVLRIKTTATAYITFGLNFDYIRDNHTKGDHLGSAFVGEQRGAAGEAASTRRREIERLIDPEVGWYVPPGQVVDDGRLASRSTRPLRRTAPPR